MDWTPGGTSADIEDRRDEGGGGGGGGGFGFGGLHLGIGGTLILLVLSLLFRTNLFTLMSGGGGGVPSSAYGEAGRAPAAATDNDEEVQFISFVLDDVQHTWEKLLPASGRPYRHVKLVLFRDLTNSGCGRADAATGPFYCPDDEKVYIDLGFYDELQRRFKAPGKFAQAYVLAHEIGHHVQKILGIEGQIRRLQEQNPRQQNALSVELELQADCFAGVWGHATEEKNIVHEADVEQGLAAAAAVGDDRLQRMAGRQVSPESFTHGSSEQRMQWFRKGLEGGTVESCSLSAGR